VREIVSRFGARLPRSVDRGDLATAGNMGLIAAIQSFDGRRGVRFEAYGDRRIRGALLVERHKQVTERLCAELGREPHDEELAAALGLSVADYQSLFGLAWPLAPGGAGRAAEGDDDAWLGELEVVPDPRARAADEELTREELLALCAQRMSPQEHRIVYLKYWQELSLREIGALTGLSESRICKIHAQLLERLAERLAGHAADL
jgi:RNA polymerase sigma factor for flagellar operon FliA